MITVGTTFYIPFNTIDFKSFDPILFEALGRSPVIGMLIASACAYVLLVIWAWREDVKDQYKVILKVLLQLMLTFVRSDDILSFISYRISRFGCMYP